MQQQKRNRRATRTILKAVRVTEEEVARLAQQAKEHQMTESGYIRRKLFCGRQPRLPPETVRMLGALSEQERKIGININQVVRSCNSKRFITKEDYRLLVADLEEIRQIYRQFYESLERLAVRGDDLQVPDRPSNREEDDRPDGSDAASSD